MPRDLKPSHMEISENSEYDAAKDAQAETEERITTIEAMASYSKITNEDETPDECNCYWSIQ